MKNIRLLAHLRRLFVVYTWAFLVNIYLYLAGAMEYSLEVNFWVGTLIVPLFYFFSQLPSMGIYLLLVRHLKVHEHFYYKIYPVVALLVFWIVLSQWILVGFFSLFGYSLNLSLFWHLSLSTVNFFVFVLSGPPQQRNL